MDLVGAWLRQLVGAATAAAIVPVALLGALLVIALGAGGLGGLGSLGQLVAGPAVPQLDTAGSSATENERVARVAPGGSDRAPARAGTSAPLDSGAGPAATVPRTQAQQGARRSVAPVPGSSRRSVPSTAVTTPPLAPRALLPPPPGVAQSQPPPLTDVLSSTVNGVVIGVQTLIDQLGRSLGLTPRR